ncbi:MAG: DUF5107 domain-containing protein [Sphaerochaetaceae bacterium]
MKKVTARTIEKSIDTYIWAEEEKLPMFAKNRVHQRSSGNPYPNAVVNQVRRDKRESRIYQVIVLENENIELEIIPKLGGRIFSARDKKSGYDFFYRQSVVKPALIGLLGLWMSGGVEFNWPCHHNPATFYPCESHIEHNKDGSVTVWLGQKDLIDRMFAQVGITLFPDNAYIETKAKITNTTDLPKSFLWWENAAVPVHEDYEIFFPHDVSYVNFHYKKTRGAYPVMDSYFNTMDNRGGSDIRKHRNTTSATSYFCGVTEDNFFGGYDNRARAGVIHYASHHTSKGKKMFTWGYENLERAWEKALTDTDGAYAELMASSYSDNQPDFSWIEPYETKEFSQFWYPYSDLGPVDTANLNLAITLAKGSVSIYPLKDFQKAVITVDEKVIQRDLEKAVPLSIRIEGASERSTVTICTKDGEVLLSYRKPENRKEVPPPAVDFPYPDKLDDAFSCYLTGVHADQYRDPKITGEPYYLHAFELNPSFVPAMISLARFYLKKMRMIEAESLLRKAIDILTTYNPNPHDGEVFTLLGLCLKYQNRYDEAYEVLHKALWSRHQISSAALLIAQIDAIRKDWGNAEKHLLTSLSSCGENMRAETLLIPIYRKTGKMDLYRNQIEFCLKKNPFNLMALNEKGELAINSWRNGVVQNGIDLACEYADAGMMEEAASVLQSIDSDDPILPVLISFFRKDNLQCDTLADVPSFPSRLWERNALEWNLERYPDCERLHLLLGNLLYGICDDTDEAVIHFSKSGESVEALRNLSITLFQRDNSDERCEKLLKKALSKSPEDLQLLNEYFKLSFIKEKDPKKLLLFWEENKEYVVRRDDVYLAGVHAANQAGLYEKALDLLVGYEFTPCEGGEHAISDEYLYAKEKIALSHYEKGEYEKAIEVLKSALTIPENLGGGVWHQVKLIAFWYYLGCCYRKLDDSLKAKQYFIKASSFPIDYFTDMYFLPHRLYLGKALIALRKKGEGEKRIEEFKKIIEENLAQKDFGYFATTPFFDSFIENPCEARRKVFGRYRRMCDTIIE